MGGSPRILQSIEALSGTPLPFGVRRLGRAEHLYRVRVGDYRIVYAVQHAEQDVIILYVRVAVHTGGYEIGDHVSLDRFPDVLLAPGVASRKRRHFHPEPSFCGPPDHNGEARLTCTPRPVLN
ncbi:type II toxin-antitoxin system RelE/ParE family toxin [Methanoculleus sp.]|uniref:type II toxin-antitoxin system RelE family toxin n=1 Tax=Methanoculleus sp. TaxID=90427 RepID=UPI00345C9AB7